MRCGDIIGGDNINAIGFIGAGKCGMSLAYYFRSKGVNVIGFSSRSNNTEDFELYSREKLINNSDIIFITTNDDNIQTVWNKIKDMNLKEKIICHCSGSVSSEIFKGADSENVCSALQTLWLRAGCKQLPPAPPTRPAKGAFCGEYQTLFLLSKAAEKQLILFQKFFHYAVTDLRLLHRKIKPNTMRRRVLRQILSYRFAIRQRSFYRSAVFQSRKVRVHCQH